LSDSNYKIEHGQAFRRIGNTWFPVTAESGLQQVDPTERDAMILPRMGRSSKDEIGTVLDRMSSFMDRFNGISLPFTEEVYNFFERAAYTSPDINIATNHIKALANNGHEVILESEREDLVEAAHDTLNERAQTIYARRGRTDQSLHRADHAYRRHQQ